MSHSDQDGLTDEQERRYGTDPRDEDSDDDGLSDWAEAYLGTNPLQPDSDGDGFHDGSEVAQHQDPLHRDRPHPLGARDGQWRPTADDPDADGLGEVEERLTGTDPHDPDTDNDGLGDWVEAIRGTDPKGGRSSTPDSTDLFDAARELGQMRAARATPTPPPPSPPTPSPTPSFDPSPSGVGDPTAFLAAAASQIGDPYRFGAETDLTDKDPDAFDSSELVEWAAAQAGVTLPDGSWRQYRHLHEGGNAITVDQALKTPGALVFGFSSDPLNLVGRPARAFVAISLGNGRVIDVSERAGEVREMDAGNFFTHAAVIPELTGELDSDGDGASDALEKEYGSDPLNPSEVPVPDGPVPEEEQVVSQLVTAPGTGEEPAAAEPAAEPDPVDATLAAVDTIPEPLVDGAAETSVDGAVEQEAWSDDSVADVDTDVAMSDDTDVAMPDDTTDELVEQLFA